MENMKWSAPWVTFVHELEALFAEDLEVKVKYEIIDVDSKTKESLSNKISLFFKDKR